MAGRGRVWRYVARPCPARRAPTLRPPGMPALSAGVRASLFEHGAVRAALGTLTGSRSAWPAKSVSLATLMASRLTSLYRVLRRRWWSAHSKVDIWTACSGLPVHARTRSWSWSTWAAHLPACRGVSCMDMTSLAFLASCAASALDCRDRAREGSVRRAFPSWSGCSASSTHPPRPRAAQSETGAESESAVCASSGHL